MRVNRLNTNQFRSLKLGIVVVATFILGVQAKAAPIVVNYSFFNGSLTQPPVFSGTTVTLDFTEDGSLLSSNPGLNALWNPLTYHDHSVLDLTTQLLNGTFRITFADGNTLDGMVFEDLTQSPMGVGPFTQTLTFTGGTGEFAGATGTLSGASLNGSMVSGSGTLNAPAVPEPVSSALLLSGLTTVLVARRQAKGKRPSEHT